MTIQIINHTVFDNDCDIGHLSKWCCGTDFLSKVGPIFSIRVSITDTKRLIDCLDEIINLPLGDVPKKHYNWHHKDFIFPNGEKRRNYDIIKQAILNG